MHCSLISPEREPALEQIAITDLPFPVTATKEKLLQPFPGALTALRTASQNHEMAWKEP